MKNNIEHDSNIANKDEYGNVTAKNQDGLCGSNFDDPNDLYINGFEDVPAECEDLECSECTLNHADKESRDCPYVDN